MPNVFHPIKYANFLTNKKFKCNKSIHFVDKINFLDIRINHLVCFK